MLKKIFTITADDWEKALSTETESFVNGIFKVLSNCNPFVRKGNLQPTPSVVQLGSGVIDTSKQIRAIVPVYVSTSKFYALGDGSKLYLVDAAGAVVTDVSAQITATAGTATAIGIWKSGLIYIVNGQVEYNTIPVVFASRVPLMTTGAANALVGTVTPFCVGPDGLGYIGNNNNVARLTSNTGTAGNITSVAAALESGFVVKKLINDGRYLVWLADNSQGGGKNRCIVAFWDLAKSTFDQIYEFADTTICSAEIIGGIIKIITPSGIYITNFSTRPRLVVAFGGTIGITQIPSNSNQTAVHQGNFLLWGTRASGSDKIYALGNRVVGKPDRLFQPYAVTGSVNIDAIGTDDTNVILSTVVSAAVVLYSLTTGVTNNTTVANVASFSTPQPYTFDHVKVVPRSPIASGNSVSVRILNSAGTKTIKASETKTNSTDPGEKNLTFSQTAAGDTTDVGLIEEVSDMEITTNVPIRTVEVWGEPTDERSSHG